MCQGNDHITLFLLSQLADHLLGELDEGYILTDFFVGAIEGVNPLFFCETKQSNFDTVFLESIGLQALS